jgi:hypothetical protein
MANLKLKYSLAEANEKIKALASKFPVEARNKYIAESGVPHSNMYRYMKGKVPSKVAANHLAIYIETYLDKNAA